MRLGLGEVIVIGFVLVVIFSASRMSRLGNALGRFVYSFRKASGGEGFVEGKATRTLPKKNIEDAQIVDPPRRG